MIATLRRNKVAIFTVTTLTLLGLYIIILLLPFHILKDWKISVDTKKTYHPDDTIILNSFSTKLHNVKGTAVRKLVCTNGAATNIYVINESTAKRNPGALKSSQPLKLPDGIALPAKCKIYIQASYMLWKIKPIIEKNQTGEFKVDSLKVNQLPPTIVYVDRTTSPEIFTPLLSKTAIPREAVVAQTSPSPISQPSQNDTPTLSPQPETFQPEETVKQILGLENIPLLGNNLAMDKVK